MKDSEIAAIWDTGTLVSMITESILEEKLSGTAVIDISELINVLDLMAADGLRFLSSDGQMLGCSSPFHRGEARSTRSVLDYT